MSYQIPWIYWREKFSKINDENLPLTNSADFKFEMCKIYGGMPPNSNPVTREGSTLSNNIEILELCGIFESQHEDPSMLLC